MVKINCLEFCSVHFQRTFLYIFMCLIYWPTSIGQGTIQPKQEVVMQIIVPLQSLESKLQSIHVYEKTTINRAREQIYSKLREKFVVDSWLNSTQSETPTEILTLYCSEIFARHVNTILSINYGSGTVAANDYIMQLADTLGYPVISWDPQYPGALQGLKDQFEVAVVNEPSVLKPLKFYRIPFQSVEDSRVLQIAPTIYHQCQALTRLMSRYNWTDFSIVTTKISSGKDFISCMRDMVKRTSVTQGFTTKAKFNLLSVVQAGDMDRRKLKQSLQVLVRTVSRVMLLHADQYESYDILEAAAEESLTGSKFMWLLTSSSVGKISTYAHKSIPVGTLGLMYNDSVDAIKEALKVSVKIWALGLNTIAKEIKYFDSLKMYPTNSCNSSMSTQFWKDGGYLYRAMRGVTIDNPPVSFTDNGIIEQVELNILNVRPFKYEKRFRRVVNKWEEVGRVSPKRVGSSTEMNIELDEIIWPGGAVVPPKGKPEKRFFRIVTLREEPYIKYVPPDSETNLCGIHSVPCKLVSRPKDYLGNLTYDSKGMIKFCCTGLCVDLLKTMAERMDFDYEMYEVGDQKWGIQNNVTGQWNGLIKEMVDKKADMVMTSIKINHQRATALDFSTPYLETGITIMVSIRKGAISATAFLEPFDMVAWLLILLLCIHVVALAMLVFEWASPLGMNRGKPLELEPYDYPSWCLILVFSVHATGASIFIFEWLSPSGLNKGQTSMREHKFSLFRSFWLIWAMLFGASVSTDNPRGMSSRFLGNVWALFALVFLASYTANLAAFMITIDEFYDLSGIDDWRLMHPTKVSPNFKFATVPDGSTEDNLKKNYPRMHRYMKKYDEITVDDGIKSLKAKKIHAFIYDATVLEYKVGKDPDCDLITVGKWYAMTGYGVGFSRGSPYVEEVNKLILELQHNGELDRLQKFWLAGACHAVKDKKDKSSPDIGILNFTSAFILLAGGVLLGTMLLAFEHLYFKFGRKCLKKYDKSGCCALVSLSMGKSLTFEQSVMEAIDYHKRHRCKDPLCETQLWKARHELDLALLKLDKLRNELSDMDRDSGHVTIEATIVEEQEDASQPNHVNRLTPNSNTHYDTPDNKLLGYSNHTNDNKDNLDKHKTHPKEIKDPDIEMDEVDKRRLQFRRSPSYTNAMSTEEDPKENNLSDPSICTREASPRRCPSYSEAVEDGPVLDGKRTNSPRQQVRTRFYDGKYYVGVANDQDESAL